MKNNNNTNSHSKSPHVNATPWPNLPQRIVKYVAKHPTALEGINFGLATKSLECLPLQCGPNSDQTWPRLLVSDPLSSPAMPQYCGLKFPSDKYLWYWSYPTRFRAPLHIWTRFLGCSHGLIFQSGAENSRTVIELGVLCPKENWTGNVWSDIPFACAALSSVYGRYGPGRSCCILMVATGVSSTAFMFWKLSNSTSEWIKKDCEISEPDHRRRGRQNGEDFMRFTNAIGVERKFYALSSQGTLAVIEETEPDRFEITALVKAKAVPSVPVRGFRECLIESDGEILVVFLVHRTSLRVVDDVEVYRLSVEDLSWVRMESLGEQRTLFIGVDCCVSVCAGRVGCGGDRVYFAQRNGVAGDWWEFDMKSGVMSQPEWAVGSGKRNSLEWDKPAPSEEDDHERKANMMRA